MILADLSNRVAENANGIRQDYSVLAELDFIFAKAQLAKSYNGVAPIFNEEGASISAKDAILCWIQKKSYRLMYGSAKISVSLLLPDQTPVVRRSL